MNIVDFSEGILGLDHPMPDGRQSRDIVARCLRKAASYEENPLMASTMISAASTLESGNRVSINIVRDIGESRLFDLQQRCYAEYEKEVTS